MRTFRSGHLNGGFMLLTISDQGIMGMASTLHTPFLMAYESPGVQVLGETTSRQRVWFTVN